MEALIAETLLSSFKDCHDILTQRERERERGFHRPFSRLAITERPTLIRGSDVRFLRRMVSHHVEANRLDLVDAKTKQTSIPIFVITVCMTPIFPNGGSSLFRTPWILSSSELLSDQHACHQKPLL